MRIVVTSDTHEKHWSLSVPDGDVFIHAGDFTMIGEPEWVDAFNTWLGMLPHKHKIVIAGNHDRSFDIGEGALEFGQKRLTNATSYLLDTGIEIDGVKFWGSPYTPFFHSDFWKFHYDPAMVRWNNIPEGLDILITHGPPRGILDKTLEGDDAGCYDLARRLREMAHPPKYHFFGHIHEGRGELFCKNTGTRHFNVSYLNRIYKPYPINSCVVIDFPLDTKA